MMDLSKGFLPLFKKKGMEEGIKGGCSNGCLITTNRITGLGPVVLIERLNPTEFCPWIVFSG